MSTSINTLQALVHELDKTSDHRRFFNVLRRAELNPRDLENYFYWPADQYGRVCLSRTDEYELLLTCWEPGQTSPIHDYEADLAWTHPLKGKLREERFIATDEGLQMVSKVSLGDEEFSFMDGSISIHRYSNQGKERAVAIHLFAKPVESWRVFDPETGAATRTVPQFDRNFCMTFEHS